MHVFKGPFHTWKTRTNKPFYQTDRPQKAKLNPADRAIVGPAVDGWTHGCGSGFAMIFVRRGPGLQDTSAGLAKAGREGYSERPWGRENDAS